VHDASDRLLIPEKLYGREREIDALIGVFDRVVAQGTTEIVLVSGYSGIGKSSVVNELHKALVPSRGLSPPASLTSTSATFRTPPWAGIPEPCPLAPEPERRRAWPLRDSLSEALGPNGQTHRQPRSRAGARDRETASGRRAAAAGRAKPVPDGVPALPRGVRAQRAPLALFLDDLQWLDAATLDLLEHLATHSEVRHLLLVGAYRDNEIGPAHPLLRTLEAIRKAGARVQEIVLAPSSSTMSAGLSAMLSTASWSVRGHWRSWSSRRLSGNPFFAIQFFIALADEGCSHSTPSRWRGNGTSIASAQEATPITWWNLMAGKLSGFLPPPRKP